MSNWEDGREPLVGRVCARPRVQPVALRRTSSRVEPEPTRRQAGKPVGSCSYRRISKFWQNRARVPIAPKARKTTTALRQLSIDRAHVRALKPAGEYGHSDPEMSVRT